MSRDVVMGFSPDLVQASISFDSRALGERHGLGRSSATS
jgi:hypothetical protein